MAHSDRCGVKAIRPSGRVATLQTLKRWCWNRPSLRIAESELEVVTRRQRLKDDTMAPCPIHHVKQRGVHPRAAIFALVAAAFMSVAQAAGSPQFSDHPATEAFNGDVATLDAGTAPENWAAVGEVVKDIIREDMAQGPNFAGAYHLATVGCGSACEAIFVIDVRDGRIHAAPEAATNGVLFRPDSRLIIIKEDPFYDLPRTYLLFDEGRFEVLQ